MMMGTVNILKNRTPKINYNDCPKYEIVWFYCAVMHPNDADGMANNVAPDQTWSVLFAQTDLSQYLEFLR